MHPERLPADILVAVAAGGVLGAEARYGLGRVLTAPWGTLLINVVGCALIGVLTTFVVLGRAPRLARPFLGTGVLGGFTTFSTYAVDVDRLLREHRVALAAGYLSATLVACLTATVAAGAVTSRLVQRGRRPVVERTGS